MKSFWLQFLFCLKKTWSIPNSKMPKTSWNWDNFTRGRAKALIDAIAYFENQRVRGRGGINIEWTGIDPRAFNTSTEREDNRWDEDQVPCGRVGTLTQEHRLGVFLQGEEEAEASLLPSLPYNLNLQGGEEAEASFLPPHLEDHSPSVRLHEAPLRLPRTMPLCLQPHGCFPSPTPLYSTQPKCSPHYDDLFLLGMPPFVSSNVSGTVAPTIPISLPNSYCWSLLPLLTSCPTTIRVIRLWGTPQGSHRLWCQCRVGLETPIH